MLQKKQKIKHRKYALKNNVRPPESTWKDRQQSVYMLNKKTLEIIKEFDSLSSACRYIGKENTFVSTISSCCRNKRFSAFGYRWVFNTEDIELLREKKPIIAWNKGLKN